MTDNTTELMDFLEDFGACMLVTEDNGYLRARPMKPYIEAKNGLIHFLTPGESGKVTEIYSDKDVAITFADTDDHDYASVSGKASISSDRSKIKELWDTQAEIWLSGEPETADVAIITVKPERAEFWKNDDNTIKQVWEMGKGYFTDETPDLGTNRKVA